MASGQFTFWQSPRLPYAAPNNACHPERGAPRSESKITILASGKYTLIYAKRVEGSASPRETDSSTSHYRAPLRMTRNKSIRNQATTGAGRGLGVLQSAANLLIAMLAGGKHTLIHGRLEDGVEEERNRGSTDRLHGQRLPKPTSLVTFLFGTRK